MSTPPAAVVPPGERVDLQRTAQETGERFGSIETTLRDHGKRLDNINGAIERIATAMGTQATAMAVEAAAVSSIQASLDAGVLSSQRRQGISTQWLLAIFAALIAVMGMGVTVAVTLVVLIANHTI